MLFTNKSEYEMLHPFTEERHFFRTNDIFGVLDRIISCHICMTSHK